MEKEDLDIRLLELMTGELTGDEVREMKRWVEESEEHRRYYRELQVAYARQRGVLRAGLVRRRGERRYRRVARRRMLWRWSGVAAAVCLVFGVSVWLWHGVDEPGGRMLADGGSIVPGSARVSLVLSSGERVDLRAGEGERLAEGTVSLNVGKEGVLEYRDSVESGSVEGRMNRLVGFVAGAMNMRAVGRGNEAGKIELLHKTRGETRMLAYLLEAMDHSGYDGSNPVVISHCFNENAARLLAGGIRNKWSGAQVEILPTSGLTSFYAEKQGLIVGY